MKKITILICTLISPFCLAETLTGVAKNHKGEVVYLEKHEIQKDELGLSKFIRVEYSKPDGTLFATMISDFSINKNIPETTFEDKRFNTKSTMRIIGDKVEFEEYKNNKSVLKKVLSLSASMVASQGFDNFIKSNETKLASEPLQFKFGILDKKDFYPLTGYRRLASSTEDVEYGIRSSSWFVRLFAQELRVTYDSKNRRLKSFIGRSNILDDSGKPQDVIIDYKWTSDS